MFRMPDIVMSQVNVLIYQGDLKTAMQLAETHELPISQARVYLAQGDPSTALSLLEPLSQQARAKGLLSKGITAMFSPNYKSGGGVKQLSVPVNSV